MRLAKENEILQLLNDFLPGDMDMRITRKKKCRYKLSKKNWEEKIAETARGSDKLIAKATTIPEQLAANSGGALDGISIKASDTIC